MCAANRLALSQGKSHRVYHAVRRYRMVETRLGLAASHVARRLQAAGPGTAAEALGDQFLGYLECLARSHDVLAGQRRAPPQTCGQPDPIENLLGAVANRTRAQFDSGWLTVHKPGVADGRWLLRKFRRQAVDDLDDLGTCLTVNAGVMKLDVKRETSLGDAGNMVQPLDDVGLPEWTAAVEGAGMDAGHLDH